MFSGYQICGFNLQHLDFSAPLDVSIGLGVSVLSFVDDNSSSLVARSFRDIIVLQVPSHTCAVMKAYE